MAGKTRRRTRLLALAAVGSLAAALAAFGATASPGALAAAPAERAAKKAESCKPLTKFKKRNFDDSTDIDNKYDPLPPGTRFTLEGQTSEGPHTVILTVTDFVKKVDGVWTRVLWDQDLQGDPLTLVESELAFHAQDENRNVWVLGEYPEEYEAGTFTGAPSTWISGVDGAKGGVLVPGKPRKGDPFLEGVGPDIDFLDCGQVVRTHQDDVCAGSTCYDNVLKIREFSPLDPEGGSQFKFYAPHVGNVKITAAGDPEGEFLDLTSKVTLSVKDRLKADREALKLERRAYHPPADICGSPEGCPWQAVYAQTDPMRFDPGYHDDTALHSLKDALLRR